MSLRVIASCTILAVVITVLSASSQAAPLGNVVNENIVTNSNSGNTVVDKDTNVVNVDNDVNQLGGGMMRPTVPVMPYAGGYSNYGVYRPTVRQYGYGGAYPNVYGGGAVGVNPYLSGNGYPMSF